MGYKEKVLEELYKGGFTVKELVKRLDDSVHLNSRTVSTYIKRLLKEGKIIQFLDKKSNHITYVTVDLYCYKYIASMVRKWKSEPEIHQFITNFALNILQLKGDFSLKDLNHPELIKAIDKIPFDEKHELYI